MVYLNIENLLKKHNKSKYWLVKALNSNYTVINSMIENRTIGIRFDTIDTLLKLFDCEIDELFIVENE